MAFPISQLPKELRLQIYESTFEPRILQLGFDAGVPFPPEMKPKGKPKGPANKLHTRLPSLFSVCQESRDLCKSIFVAFGPTYIHPSLDTLYISLYAVGRMLTTELQGACVEDESSSAYPVSAFDRVAIEYGDIRKEVPANRAAYKMPDVPPEDLEAWKQLPHTWQIRHGKRMLCPPGMWPATDFAEFFRCFGTPREILCVTNGVLRWGGGNSIIHGPRVIEFVATELGSEEQEKVVEFLKAQIPEVLSGKGIKFTVVEAQKHGGIGYKPAPYSGHDFIDLTERYLWA